MLLLRGFLFSSWVLVLPNGNETCYFDMEAIYIPIVREYLKIIYPGKTGVALQFIIIICPGKLVLPRWRNEYSSYFAPIC